MDVHPEPIQLPRSCEHGLHKQTQKQQHENQSTSSKKLRQNAEEAKEIKTSDNGEQRNQGESKQRKSKQEQDGEKLRGNSATKKKKLR
jgi:hypothetical protein